MDTIPSPMARLESAKEVKVSRSFRLSVRRHHGKHGKVLKLRIAAGDITVSRLLRTFQASTHCIYIWILAKSPNDMTATVQDYVILSKS